MDIKLSPKQRIRLVASLAVLFSILGGWVFVRPAWEVFQVKHGELETMLGNLPPERPHTESLGQLIRRITQTRAALDEQRRRFPIAENVSQLLVELQGVLSGADITRFYPTKLDPVDLPALASADIHVLQQKIMVDAEGDFFALRNFLEALERFPHPVQVRSFEIGAPKNRDQAHPDLLAMSFTMSAYLLDRAIGGPDAEQRALDELLAEIQEAPVEPPPPAPAPAPPEPVEIAAPPPLPPRILAPPAPPVPPVRPATPRPAQVPQAPARSDETAGWRIVGILYARDSHTAIIQVGQSQVAVGKGDEIEAGWVVERIDPRRVFVRRGAMTKVLDYPDAAVPEGSGR